MSRFSFTGTAREYFKIWIVNVLLTVLTLGIYSVWAKVSTKRYFYRHTWLRGLAFVYLGEPRELLARRLAGIGLFALCAYGASGLPRAGALLALLSVVFVSALSLDERVFHFRSSAHGDARFAWKSSPGETLIVGLLLPLLSVVTFGLALPYCGYRRQRFLAAHGRYGTTPLSWTASLKDFRSVYLRAFALLLAGAVFSIAFVAVLETPVNRTGPSLFRALHVLAVPTLFSISMALLGLGAWAYPRTALSHLFLSGLRAGESRLGSIPSVHRTVRLHLENAVAVVFSLGLLVPWARIRKARHELENLTLLAGDGLGGAVGSVQEEASSDGAAPAVTLIGDRGRNAILDGSWRLALPLIAVAMALPALRHALPGPPPWLDNLIGGALVFEFFSLFLTTFLIPAEILLVPLTGLGVLLWPRRFVGNERGRWGLQPAISTVLWSLLVVNAPVLSANPELSKVYASTILILALAYPRERVGGAWRRRKVFLLVLAVALGWICVPSSPSVVDVAAILSWLAIGLCVCLLAPPRLHFRDACAGLIVLAFAHLVAVTLGGLRNPAGASDSNRIVLGAEDSYSFCEMPGTNRVYAVLPTCLGENTGKCRDDVVAEYDASTLTPTRRFAPFRDGFEGRMLHLVCLEDSILVGMSFTSLDGVPRKENVMELSARDGYILRRDVMGPGVGHRLLLDPDGNAVFAVSEYSNVVRRLSLGDRDGPSEDIDLGQSELQARFGPFPGSLQTEVDALRPSRGTGFFAEWIGGGRVSEVDLRTGNVVATYATNSGGNHSLAIDDEYGRLLVTSLWGLDVVDLETGRPILRRRTEMGPRLPIIDTRRDLVYVSTTLGNHVWVFDRRTFALKGKLVVGVGGRNAHLTRDGRYLLTGGGGRHVAWDLDWHARSWIAER